MRCEQVVWELSEADGRVMSRREIQAHLRACAECRAFGESISRRRGELKALTPLPVAASAALLQGVLGASSGAAGGRCRRCCRRRRRESPDRLGRRQDCGDVRGGGCDRDDSRRSRRPDRRPARRRSGPGAREHADPPAARPGSGAVPPGRRAEGNRARPSARSAPLDRVRSRQAVEDRTAGGGPGATTGGGSPSASTPPSQATDQGNGAGTTKAKKNASLKGQGKAAGLPPSSAHGQQTAAAHKSPHANASPGTPRGAGHRPSVLAAVPSAPRQ